MKKINKIFSIVLPLLLLSIDSYAAEMITENLTGSFKWVGVLIAVGIIALIIFFGYKSDKKSEERQIISNNNPFNHDDNYEMEEENEIEESNFTKSNKVSFVDEETNEEESLFNSVNEYVNSQNDNFGMLEEDDEEIDEVSEYIETEEQVIEKDFIDDDQEDDFAFDMEKSIEDKEKEEKENLFSFNLEESIENQVEEKQEEVLEENSFETSFLDEEETDKKAPSLDLEDDFDKDDFGYEIEDEKEEIIEESIIEDNDEEEQEDPFSFDLEETIKNQVEEKEVVEEAKHEVKKYTGKKIGKKANSEPVIDLNEVVEEYEYEDDEDDDTGVPTFDELLKQSEEAGEFDTAEEFDFMAQMEENLKKNKEERLEKKSTAKKQTAKKQTTKKTTTKKSTPKKKKTE